MTPPDRPSPLVEVVKQAMQDAPDFITRINKSREDLLFHEVVEWDTLTVVAAYSDENEAEADRFHRIKDAEACAAIAAVLDAITGPSEAVTEAIRKVWDDFSMHDYIRPAVFDAFAANFIEAMIAALRVEVDTDAARHEAADPVREE